MFLLSLLRKTLVVAAIASLSGCGKQARYQGAAVDAGPDTQIPDMTTPATDEPVPTSTGDDPPVPLTQVDTFTRVPSAQIDILIAVAADRSPEFERTTEALLSLIEYLPPTLDFRIGVLSGNFERSGRLIQMSTEPLILNSKDYSRSLIAEFLKKKLLPDVLPKDTYGGEGLVHSLMTFLENPGAFFRPEAGLAVLFISDDDDVCFNDPQLRGYPSDEIDAYMKFCREGAVNRYTPEWVVQKIKDSRPNLPVSVNGIFPSTKDSESAEGYTKMAMLTHGSILDYAILFGLTTQSINEIVDQTLLDIVDVAVSTLQTLFSLSKIPLPNTLSVTVDGAPAAFTYIPAGNRIEVTLPGTTVKATYMYQPIIAP